MEQILERLGDPGRYHILLACLFAITWWSVTLGNVAMAFYGFTPKLECSDIFALNLADGTNGSFPSNVTVAKDQCSYTVTRGNDTLAHHKCTTWTYDDEGRGTSTISTEWNLVCEDSYKISVTSTLFFVGVFFGALIFGFVSDHLGRKKTLALCLYTQMPISFAIAFMSDYLSFTILRFFLGIWLQGISTVAFVHCIEFFRQKYRGVVMVGFGISWAFGQVLLAFFAYVFPNWRHIQMAASCVALVTVPYFWWLPESPRWLLVKGRFEEIISGFVYRAAKMNGLDMVETKSWCWQQLNLISQQQQLAATTERTQSFINILRTPVLLKRLLVMCYIWCVASLTYYVFILNTKNLAGDRYLNFTVGAAVEIVVNLAIIFVMTRFGRKRPLLVCCFLVGVFCIISGTVPEKCGDVDIRWVVTVFATLGKMASAAIMCLIFVYAAELFPTFARGSCLALCGCSLRVGGMLAPQIIYLRDTVFAEFPYIAIASLIALCGVVTIFLPETFGRNMPNTIEEAVDMLPEPMHDKDRDSRLLKDSCQCFSDQTTNSESSSHNQSELDDLTPVQRT